MAQVKVVPLKPHKVTKTKTEVLQLTLDAIEKWQSPPFQRELRENARVVQLKDELLEQGVIPGVITLGRLEKITYVLDGQHRLHAFKLSGLDQIYADVRTHEFDSMAEMGAEFVALNSRLVVMRPDDVLRGLEESLPTLRKIREECPFVGYSSVVRHRERGAILGMSMLLRTWFCANGDLPLQSPPGGGGAAELAARLTDEDCNRLIKCLKVLERAWGKDKEHARLWSSLNLILCIWLWNQCVIAEKESANRKAVRLTQEMFGKAMMSVAADSNYYDWLMGRRMGERDRAPAYKRLRTIVGKRLLAETGEKLQLPAPNWYTRK